MSTEDRLQAALSQVQDCESFLAFVKVLVRDRERSEQAENKLPSSSWGPESGGWENISIAQFLEAAVAWAEDTCDSPQGISFVASWKSFASFLYSGKVYE